MHNWVVQRPDFKSGVRVVKMVLNTQCYQYVWLTMWFHQTILNTASSPPSLVGGASACAVPPLKYLWQAFLALLCSFKWTGWLLNSLWPWRLKLSQLASSWVWEFISLSLCSFFPSKPSYLIFLMATKNISFIEVKRRQFIRIEQVSSAFEHARSMKAARSWE